ncbi:MAG: 5-(carboxyamino)imidazole ribonucleotide synthase [Crocinitomicaceae bacterium]|nr:5-(carboxyamino)imidazole ribonucleotide synthase [Crocinitomicaceae bacterium]
MKNAYDKDFRIGILGGGQLGRMILQESPNLNLSVYTMDSSLSSPCGLISENFVVGDIRNYDDVIAFGKNKDVLTIEIENVNIKALEALEKDGVKVFPQPRVVRILQDKGVQKEFYKKNGIPTSDFKLIESAATLKDNLDEIPYVLKMRTGGYDGKGVQIIKLKEDLNDVFEGKCLVEDLVDLDKELSVIVARNESGECRTFPLVEQSFNPIANLVEFLFSPADVSQEIEKEASRIAIDVIEKLDMVGLLAVEFFLDKQGNLLVNEVAPRPHNSGHQTIEGNYTSQFGQLLRSILNLPLGDTKLRGASVMVNVLGEPGFSGNPVYEGLGDLLSMSGVYPHLYGKDTTKPYRKMGHVTVIDNDLEQAKIKANKVKDRLKVISATPTS